MRSALLLAALAALQTLGCSVVVGGAVNDPCATNDDCKALGFVNATCNQTSKQCEVSGGAACTTDDDCTDAALPKCDTATNVCVAATGCETSEECEAQNGGKPSYCRPDTKTCVQLTSEDCAQVLGNYKDPNAIVVGFLGPLVGADASTGLPIHNGAKLALHELETNVIGLPGGANGKPRPIAMVCCDDLSAPEANPRRAAKHLVSDIGTQAILGPAFSGIMIETATGITIPAGVLTISASATNPSITNLADNGLVWRTCPSDAIQAIPLAGLVTSLEVQVRAEQSLMAADQIRLAMAVKGDAYGTGLADVVTPLLTFNGKSAADNADNFARVDYADPSGNPNPDLSNEITQIVALKPQIILMFGTTEAAKNLYIGIETAWNDLNPMPPRPYYLFPDGGKVSELTDGIGADDDRRKRVRGTVPGVASELYGAFKLRYKAYIKNEPLAYADTGYDAMYLLAYGMLAVGDKPITGIALADALKKMSKGTPVDAGPTSGNINKAFDAIQSSGEIDYNGASGPLNFDPKTGEAKADIDIWCIGRNAQNMPVFLSSGAHFDANTSKIVGTYNDQGQCD